MQKFILVFKTQQQSAIKNQAKESRLLFAVQLKVILILFFTSFLFMQNLNSQQFEVVTLDNPAPGYIKLDWQTINYFFLLDNYGRIQHRDTGFVFSRCTYYKLLSNGYFIGASSNKYYYFNNRIELIDSIPKPTSYEIDFHDVELMPNGHFMLLCSEVRVMDLSELLDGGDANALVTGSVLVETDRSGTIYWLWKALDHFNILDVTDDIDLTQHTIDFNHGNSIVIDTDGNVLFSSRNLDEISKINKATGEFIWRMGGSKCENNEFTFINDDYDGFYGFSHQHSLNLLANGNFLMFDNGNSRPNQFSRAVEYQINQSTKTATRIWEYRRSPDIYRPNMGNVQRLENGNTLINWSIGIIEEVRNDKTVVYKLTMETTNPVYRAYKTVSKMNSVTRNLTGTGNYSFNDTGNETNSIISVSSITGSGDASIVKHYYSPPIAVFSDSSFSFLLPYRWVFAQRGISVLGATIKINVSNLQFNDEPRKLSIYHRALETSGNFTELNTGYSSTNNEISASFNGFGEFVIGSYVLSTPVLSTPIDGKYGIPVNGVLKWNKLKGATKYLLNVSRSSAFSQLDVNQVIAPESGSVPDTTFTCQNLQYNTQYFWRLKGMNPKDTSDWSNIYTFISELNPPVLTSPGIGTIGTKLNDTLRWNSVSGSQNYRIQVSSDSNFSILIYQNNRQQSNFEVLDSLDFNSWYYWRVCSYRISDTSRWSEIRRFKTTLSAPVLIHPVCDSINIPVEGTIKWQSVAGAESYRIQISKDLSYEVIDIDSDSVIKNEFPYKNLNFNKVYHYRIKAKRSTDSSIWSKSCSFTTFLSTPKLISPRIDSTLKSDSASLSWTAVSGTIFYNLQLSESKTFDSKIFINETALTKTEYTIKKLPPQKEIYWRVRALADSQLSEWSESRKMITGKGMGVNPPLLSEPYNNSLNNKISGNFYWSAVESAIRYNLELAADINFSDIIIRTRNIVKNSEPYSGLEFDKFYFWRVKAFTEYDSSNWSEAWRMKTEKKSGLADIKLISPEYDALQVETFGKLRWSGISGAKYFLQLCENEDFINNIYDIKELQVSSFDYFGLELNKGYFWRVQYIMGADTSNWSVTWSFMTASSIILPTPEILFPDDNQKSFQIDGKLAWNNVSDATKYHILISEYDDFYPAFLTERNILKNELKLQGLEYNTKYYWRVAGSNDSSTSRWSEKREFLTELKSPIILNPADDTSGLSVTGDVDWTLIEGASKYHIQIASDSMFQSMRTESDAWENLYVYELPDNSINYCRVKAVDNGNESRWSRVVQFIIGSGTGVNENRNNLSYSIYPNPVIDKCILNFNLDAASEVTLAICNMLGTELFKKNLGHLVKSAYSFELDFGLLYERSIPGGMYFVQLRTLDKISIIKIIILRQ